jgi:hypothetical protein
MAEPADRKELAQWAQNLAFCIKDEADEDAHQWCLDILDALWRWQLRENVRLRGLAERMKK